jgi:4,5-dihydroxyphthalate decarboxylase
VRVPLSLACGAYDRTAALARGDIRPEGIDLTFLALLAGNEDTLATFVRYSFEQGLISREREPAELFAPETREAYVI